MANIGGKVYIYEPITFASGLVSIGDVYTAIDPSMLVTDSIVIGESASIGDYSPRCVVIGGDASIAFRGYSSVVIGAAAKILDMGTLGGSDHSVVIGHNTQVGEVSWSSVAIGPNTQIYYLCSNSVAIGPSVHIRGNDSAVALGSSSDVEGGSIQGVALGFVSTVSGVSKGIAIGSGATVTSGSSAEGLIAIGFQARADRISAVAIGPGSFCSGDYSVSIGDGARVESGCQNTIGIGYNVRTTAFWDVNNIIIGRGLASPISTEQTFYSIVIGAEARAAHANYDVIIGYQASTINEGGHEGYWSIIIGSQASAVNSSFATVIGPSSSAGDLTNSATWSVVMGGGSSTLSRNTLAIGGVEIDEQSQFSVAIGYGGYFFAPYNYSNSIVASPNAVSVGTVCTVAFSPYSTIAGDDNLISTAPYSSALGLDNLIDDTGSGSPDPTSSHIIVGLHGKLHNNTYGSATFGVTNVLTDSAYSIVAGIRNTVEDGDYAIIFGGDCRLLSGASPDYAILIGSNVTSSAAYSITIGTYAENHVANTMVIGSSNNTVFGLAAIHTMVVLGYNGGPLDTVSVTDNPANSGDTGLTVVCNIGAVFSNKVIQAAVAPGGGARFLYILP